MTEEREQYRTNQQRRTGGKLLIDEYPLIILPSLAREVGLEEAVILQQIHFWLESGQGADAEGARWIYNSYTQWQGQFPFWSVQKVERIIRSLEAQGWLISGSFNKLAMDKTKWYRPNYEKLGQPFPASGKPSLTSGKGVPASGKPIPETTTEITSDKESGDTGTTNSVFTSFETHCRLSNIRLSGEEQEEAFAHIQELELSVGPLRAEAIINRATLHVGALKYPTWPALKKVLRNSAKKEKVTA